MVKQIKSRTFQITKIVVKISVGDVEEGSRSRFWPKGRWVRRFMILVLSGTLARVQRSCKGGMLRRLLRFEACFRAQRPVYEFVAKSASQVMAMSFHFFQVGKFETKVDLRTDDR